MGKQVGLCETGEPGPAIRTGNAEQLCPCIAVRLSAVIHHYIGWGRAAAGCRSRQRNPLWHLPRTKRVACRRWVWVVGGELVFIKKNMHMHLQVLL